VGGVLISARSAKRRMKRRIGIQGFLMVLAIILSLGFSRFLFPQWRQEALDEFLDVLGTNIILLGFLFRIAARGHKAEISHRGESLIKDGLYGLMRHPMYFGTFFIGLGIVLVLFQWWAFLLFLAVFLLIYAPQTNREEDNLFRRFGQEYKNYCQTTPRYIPDLAGWFEKDLRDYLFFNWSWLKKELPSLITVTAIVIAIETWHDRRLFGYKECTKELGELLLVIVFFMIISGLFYAGKNRPRKN